MRRPLAACLLVVLLLAAVAPLAAHGGKSHRLMGTVEEVQAEQLVLTDRDGAERRVRLTADTRYEKGGKPATRADLAAGARVSIELDESDTVARVVKIGAGAGS